MLFWFTLFRKTRFKTNFFLVVFKNSTDLLQWRLKTFQKKNFQNKAWEIHMAINQISEKEKLFDILFWKNSFILLLTVIRLSEEHRSSDGILVRQIFKKSNELDRKLLIKVFKGLAVHENCLRHWVGLLIQTQNIDFSVAIAT